MNRPIPAFYCVYLLRSTTVLRSNARVYIGSTPNPKRRLRQHNGEIKGGAKSTHTRNGRRWEIALIVAGFPSKIAALQFEWSWQNTHLTRHVGTEDRKPFEVKTHVNRHGRPVKKPQRPLAQLDPKLADLHTLLRSKSFRTWPLDVRFFNLKEYQHWQTKTLTSTPFHLPQYTNITFEGADTTGQDAAPDKVRGINDIDVSYNAIRDHVCKSKSLLSTTPEVACAVCNTSMHVDRDLFAVCPNGDCAMTAHLTCLSSRSSSAAMAGAALLPVRDTCPSCNSSVSWTSLAREASLRARGLSQIEKLLKPQRKKPDTDALADTASAGLGCDEDYAEELASNAESEDSIMIRDDIIAGQFYHREDAMSDHTDNLSDLDLPDPTNNATPYVKPGRLAVPVPDSDVDDVEEISA